VTTHSYTELSPEIPPIPILQVALTLPGIASENQVMAQGILDTGSDCTLVPLPLLVRLTAKVAGRSIAIPVGGVKTVGIPHYVGLLMSDRLCSPIRVFGCPESEIGEFLIIGRDVLNQYRIEFDGLRLTFSIF
jgi:hypothetical protein